MNIRFIRILFFILLISYVLAKGRWDKKPHKSYIFQHHKNGKDIKVSKQGSSILDDDDERSDHHSKNHHFRVRIKDDDDDDSSNDDDDDDSDNISSSDDDNSDSDSNSDDDNNSDDDSNSDDNNSSDDEDDSSGDNDSDPEQDDDDEEAVVDTDNEDEEEEVDTDTDTDNDDNDDDDDTTEANDDNNKDDETKKSETSVITEEKPNSTIAMETEKPESIVTNETESSDTTIITETEKPDTTITVTEKSDTTVITETEKPDTTIAIETEKIETTTVSAIKEPDTSNVTETDKPDPTNVTETDVPDTLVVSEPNAETEKPDTTVITETEKPETTITVTEKPDTTIITETEKLETTITITEKPDTTVITETEKPNTTIAIETEKLETTTVSEIKEPDTTIVTEIDKPDPTNVTETDVPDTQIVSEPNIETSTGHTVTEVETEIIEGPSSTIIHDGNDCDRIESYLTEQNAIGISYECSDDDGSLVYLDISDDCLPNEVIDELLSFTTTKIFNYEIIQNDKCTKSFPDKISNLKNLEELKIDIGSININYDALKNISFKKLIINNTDLSQNDIKRISEFSSITDLDILMTYSQDLDLQSLKKLKNLTALHINGDNVKVNSIKNMKKLSKLEILGNITKDVTKEISNLSSLKEIEIYHSSNVILNLEAFSGLTNLESLFIENISGESVLIDEKSLYYPNLKKLYIKAFTISQYNFIEISKDTLLEELSFTEYNYSEEDLDHSYFKKLTNLKIAIFDRSESRLYTIPTQVCQENLIKLVVSGIGISFVEEDIYKCKNLKEIDLSGNQLTEFPKMLTNLKKLKYIDLHNNLIDDKLPEALSDLEDLDYVDFSENVNIKGKTLTNDNLQACIYDNSYSLCKAKDMDCLYNVTFEDCSDDEKTIANDCDALYTYLNRKGVSDALFECSVNDKGELDYIYIRDRLLVEEDIDKIFSYESVTKLVLTWQNTKYTIDKLTNLKNLEELEIYNSKGGILDLTAMNFEKLNILDIGCPRSKNVRVTENSLKGFKSSKILNLKDFAFSQNDIDVIGTFSNLEEINCDSCSFGEGLNFESFKNLTKLVTIYFSSFNKYGKPIYKIPLAFTEISSLKNLIMIRQKITTIPDEVSNLKNLEALNLSNNELKLIPESLNSLTKLKEVYFGGESLEGKILTNDSLEKCSYDNEAALCKTKEMSCLGESNSLIKQCK